jgi:hypothetical protein
MDHVIYGDYLSCLVPVIGQYLVTTEAKINDVAESMDRDSPLLSNIKELQNDFLAIFLPG